jgi:hypothetical protein
VLDPPELARAAEAGLHLVDDQDDAVVAAELAHTREELRRRDDEAALALHRLDHDRGDVLCGDLRHEGALECRQRLAGARAAVVLRERDAVDVRRERAEAGLVRMGLGREGQRQQRASVEAALECDHRRSLRVRASELDGVLDRLGAGVEERGFHRAGDRRGRDEALGERDVELVRHDREVGVEEARGLLLHGFRDARVLVTDVEAADAAREVEEGVAVDVRERGAVALVDHDRDVDRERVGDDLCLALQDLLRARAGDRRPELDCLGRRHQRSR